VWHTLKIIVFYVLCSDDADLYPSIFFGAIEHENYFTESISTALEVTELSLPPISSGWYLV
jgi:hypothetical protein